MACVAPLLFPDFVVARSTSNMATAGRNSLAPSDLTRWTKKLNYTISGHDRGCGSFRDNLVSYTDEQFVETLFHLR